MTIKTMALAGCAAIALGAMGTPALASHHRSAKSQEAIDNAREAKITEQLNEQQVQNPGSIPDAKSASADQSGGQQMAETTTQTDMNAGTSNDPNAKANSSAIGRAASDTGAEIDKAAGVKTPVTKAELRKAVAASQVQDPAKTLATAELKTRKGDPVGEVKAVEVNPDGTARVIEANVGGFLGMGEREVNIDASNLRYIKDRNILVTDMTKPQIENLPPVNANEKQDQKNNTY